jgi:hypothetical protein
MKPDKMFLYDRCPHTSGTLSGYLRNTCEEYKDNLKLFCKLMYPK